MLNQSPTNKVFPTTDSIGVMEEASSGKDMKVIGDTENSAGRSGLYSNSGDLHEAQPEQSTDSDKALGKRLKKRKIGNIPDFWFLVQ